MGDERAMSEDDIETMAWELETKMIEICKDPRAALSAGLAKVRAIMLAEMKAGHAEMKADWAKRRAEMMAKIEAELAAELRAALADRLRRHNATRARRGHCPSASVQTKPGLDSHTADGP